MSLKTAMAADQSVMLNTDEHARQIQLNGATVTAIVNAQEIKPEGNPGLNISEVELYVRGSDFDPLPRVGQQVNYNGEDYWLVVQVRPSAVLTALVLQRNDT